MAFLFLTQIFIISDLRADSPTASLIEFTASLQQKFPDVPTLSVRELARMGTPGSANPMPLLLDARAPKEFAVSHLPGAHLLDHDFEAQLQKLRVNPDTEIVVYCAVGYRSALVTRSLHKLGFRKARNLDGSLFAWANAGLPLINSQGESTSSAHPFNKRWGRFLDKVLWKWEP